MNKENNITQSTFNKVLLPIDIKNAINSVKNPDVDKYMKKFTTSKLIRLIIYAQLAEKPNLSAIKTALISNEELQTELELESISTSQISRKLRELPTDIIQELFGQVVRKIKFKTGTVNAGNVLNHLNIIDASTISLSITRYRWAEFKKTKSGIKIHLKLRTFEGGQYPDGATITVAKKADKTQMDKLIVEDADILNVFDRGYVDYEKFDEYTEKGIRFVTRLKSNAIKQIIEEFPVYSEKPVTCDQKVLLGINSQQMQHNLRLIITTDSQGNEIVILTNDFNLSCDEISDIYRYRWKIELFFKWIKQHLKVKHFYGLSLNAVINQLFIALLTYCLILLIKLKTNSKDSLLKIQRLLCEHLLHKYQNFLDVLLRPPRRTSMGRRKINQTRTWNVISKQYSSHVSEDYEDANFEITLN